MLDPESKQNLNLLASVLFTPQTVIVQVYAYTHLCFA